MLSNRILKSAVIIIVLCTISVAKSHPQNTYYINNTGGSDQNDGLSGDRAWKTTNKINQSFFSPGDSILFICGGVWNETLIISSSGSSDNPIVFSSYGYGEKPEINISEPTDYGVIISYVNNIVFQNFEVTGKCFFGICIDAGSNVTIEHCYVHHISVSNDWHGILLRYDPSYVKILNNEISYCGAEGIYGPSRNIEIGYNYIHNIDLTGNVGDCIQLNNIADNYYVHHNILDHSNSTSGKGVFVCSHRAETAGSDYSHGVFEYNTCIGGISDDFAFGSTSLGDTIRYNIFTTSSFNITSNALKGS